VDPLTGDPPGNPDHVLRTPRLLLRNWTDADVEPLLALSTDPEVMRHFPRPSTRAEVEGLVARHRDHLANGRPGLYAVERLADRELVGLVGLAVPTFEAPFTPCVEVGWRLARPFWGHGYATEAAREALRHGFETLGLPEIVSYTSVSNVASQRVMERLGMHRDPAEDFEHPRVEVGHPVRRHVLYRLQRVEWERQRGSARDERD
jgi:RimJ/RimL family protein N-acetyltransferase